MARGKSFPSWRYGPGGQSRIFQEGDKVPAGWEDHPEKVKEPKTRTRSARKGETVAPPERSEQTGSEDEQAAEEQRYREEVLAYLKAEGIEHDENASTEALEELMNAEG